MIVQIVFYAFVLGTLFHCAREPHAGRPWRSPAAGAALRIGP
jgi:hypothetical protein